MRYCDVFAPIKSISYSSRAHCYVVELRLSVDNIKMDLKEMGINMGNWLVSAQDRFIGESL